MAAANCHYQPFTPCVVARDGGFWFRCYLRFNHDFRTDIFWHAPADVVFVNYLHMLLCIGDFFLSCSSDIRFFFYYSDYYHFRVGCRGEKPVMIMFVGSIYHLKSLWTVNANIVYFIVWGFLLAFRGHVQICNKYVDSIYYFCLVRDLPWCSINWTIEPLNSQLDW